MSKAVLVIDMPKNCSVCSLCHLFSPIYGMCEFKKMPCFLDGSEGEKRPDWCPLKPLPEKKETFNCILDNAENTFNEGYNACIDGILGEIK